MPVDPVPLRRVRFRVSSALQGVPEGNKEIIVGTGRGGGDCGYLFEVGQEYVVDAYRSADGWLETGICTRTRLITDAGEDLAWFRKMEHAPATGSLKVLVTRRPWDKGTMAVTLERDGTRRRSELDSRGSASFADLPAGEYTFHVEQDGDMPDDPKVSVRPKGCQELYFSRSARVSGRVRTKTGAPADWSIWCCGSPDPATHLDEFLRGLETIRRIPGAMERQ
ncbi:MAG: hypothetical protein QM757_09900 [Paludibaculum sp.]